MFAGVIQQYNKKYQNIPPRLDLCMSFQLMLATSLLSNASYEFIHSPRRLVTCMMPEQF